MSQNDHPSATQRVAAPLPPLPAAAPFPSDVLPSRAIGRRIASMVQSESMNTLIERQDQMITSLKSTSRTLEAFNEFSSARFEENALHVEQYVAMLKEMKSNLETIFKRIRVIKAKAMVKYPESFNQAEQAYQADHSDEDDEE
ncbi:hypothetical protein DFJ73DRAFT_29301 [Zopfochytrium polystomum]|nr:hypothetical protein DFJ73DRAFT_29301 [Zopfochytrium polystomum]